MNNDFVSIRGKSLPRRMVLQGIASLLGGAFAPSAFAATADSCQLTEREILGPFYRFGSPFQTKLAGPNEPGEQANKAGLYDTDKPGNFTEHVDFHLRGMMLTDQQGNYEFETVMPGRYPIPPNLPRLEKYAGLTRPAHIHFRVSESLHIPLTTQLYFKDDPYIAEDPWASRKSSLAIGLKQDGELLHGVFDLVLARGF
jgi:catechol 1,2-dioxygenase